MRNKLLATVIILTIFTAPISAVNAASESSNQLAADYKIETIAEGLGYP